MQGYRGAMALLPDKDLGIAILWNSESALPSGLLPTVLDAALGLNGGQWLDDNITLPATQYVDHDDAPPGTDASAASAAPR